MEKNKESQTQSLAELQQELKSLKALLLSRGLSASSAASPTLTGKPSIPAWQLASANQNDTSGNVGASGSSSGQSSGTEVYPT
jgi:peroxin-14